MQEKRDNSDRKQIRFGELLERINAVRGKTSFAAWVKQACEEKLAADKSEKWAPWRALRSVSPT